MSRTLSPCLCILLIVGLGSRSVFAQPKPAGVSQPTLVTLKLADAPQKQIFDELGKQAGTEFLTLPPKMFDKVTGANLTIDLTDKPFWLAMREVCAKSGISLKHATDSAIPRIILTRDNQNWTDYPVATSGPFLVNLIGLHRASTVDMRKPGEISRQFFAKFTVFCEPKTRLLRGSTSLKIEEAKDDKGNSLVPKPAADEPTSPMNFISSWVYNIEGKLEYPAKDPGGKIPLLRCSANFLVQTKSEMIDLADPLAAKGKVFSIAGRKITLKELKHNPEEWEATVTFSRDQLSAEQWAAALFPGNSMKLSDAEGRSTVARGFGLGGKGDEATFIFKFEKDPPKGTRIGKPAKLTWEIPTETKELPLVFEFKDVTVP